MSDPIGDLIFDNDSTLFKVLNTLEIPELATQVKGVENQVEFVSDQIRQLGLVVDKDRSDATAAIIAVDTKVDLVNIDLVGVHRTLTNQAITNEDLYSQIGNVRTIGVQASTDVRALETTVANLSTLVAGFDSRISKLEVDVSAMSTKLNRIDTDVTLAKADILITKADVTVVKRVPGCVISGVDYTVCNRASGNQWIRNFKFGGAYGGRLVWGTWYSCVIDGVNNYVKLIDPMGFMTDTSVTRSVTTAVNYTRLWYGLNTSVITYAEVYFTPKN